MPSKHFVEAPPVQVRQWELLGQPIPDPRLWTHIEDDVSAAVYYGSYGLLDPKMPFEAFAIRRGMGKSGFVWLLAAAGISMSFGFGTALAIGWLVDPMDKRKGGLAEHSWFHFLEEEILDTWQSRGKKPEYKFDFVVD